MSVYYGNSAVVQRSEVFKNGRTSVKLEEGGGRLSTSITDENIERIRDMILQIRRKTTDDVTHQLEIVTVQPVKLFTTNLPSIKSYHDSFRSDSQNYTKRSVWASAIVV
jgi:hypothetical protein